MGALKNEAIHKRAAARDKSADKGGRVAFADFKFVRLELLADEKDKFKALLASGEFDDISPDEFVSQGYTVKYSPGDAGKTVICSITQPMVNHCNGGLVLTGRGRDSAVALAVCAYKHVYLCTEGQWREAENRRGTAFDDIA